MEGLGKESGTSNINPLLVFFLCQLSYFKREDLSQREVGGILRISQQTRVRMGVLKVTFTLM